MALDHEVQQAVDVAAKLGIADMLVDGPRRSEEIAALADVHPGALYRLLRALAGFGIFAEDGAGRFRLTPPAEALRSLSPQTPGAEGSSGSEYSVFDATRARAGSTRSRRQDVAARAC